MATKTTTRKGFATRCPYCGAEDTLKLDLSDMREMTCTDCDSEVTPDDIRKVMAGWQALLAWLDSAPVYEAAD
jgi:Zn ribbon nucleic-acid-binding protein